MSVFPKAYYPNGATMLLARAFERGCAAAKRGDPLLRLVYHNPVAEAYALGYTHHLSTSANVIEHDEAKPTRGDA